MPKYVMNDGREFTDYNASCILNNLIQTKYKITSSHNYREFLQKNSEKVMKDLADCNPKQGCSICPVCQTALTL
jgi:hypothetical protein